MKIKSNQVETPALQHLITNLAYKLKPNQKKTQYLRARIDTFAHVNILPVSMYKLIYAYTTVKIRIIESSELFVVHQDTSSLRQITFHITSHEGSVVLSCETSLRLSLIQHHSNLDQIPDSASLICSNADHPIKRKSKKRVQVSKQSQIVFTRKE